MSTQRKPKLDNFLVNIAKYRGPIGLNLLVEVLGWDAQRLDPSKYKESDHRHFLITKNTFGDDERLQDVVCEVQNEIRKDLLSILKPELVTGGAVHQHVSPCRRALSDLIIKLNGFNWKEYLALYPGPKPVAKLAIFKLECEQAIDCGLLEIGNEKFSTWETTSFQSRTRHDFLRDRLYRILYLAIKSGEISKLRLCEYSKCGRFFVGKRRHCSEGCRIKFYNEDRRETFKENYKKRKLKRINQARKLYKKNNPIEEILEQTGLTFKALERAKII